MSVNRNFKVVLLFLAIFALAMLAIAATGATRVIAAGKISPNVICEDYSQTRWTADSCGSCATSGRPGFYYHEEVRTCNTCDPYCGPWHDDGAGMCLGC